MRYLGGLIVLTCAALTLGGCGAGGSSRSGNATAENHIGARSPKAILAAVSRELRQVRSYHFAGQQTDKDGHTRITADVSSSGAVRFSTDTEGKKLRAVVLGTQTYLNADASYWRQSGGSALSRRLAGRWVKIPTSRSAGLSKSIKRLLPRELAYCITRGIGRLTKSGTRSDDGRPVIVLRGSGQEDGTAPGEFWVAATGPPLPVRDIQTGPDKPGGPQDPRCDDPDSTVTRSDIRISGFDKPLHITAPPGALDLTRPGGDPGPQLSA